MDEEKTRNLLLNLNSVKRTERSDSVNKVNIGVTPQIYPVYFLSDVCSVTYILANRIHIIYIAQSSRLNAT